MDKVVEEICTAVRKSDYAEVRRILEAVAKGRLPLATATLSAQPKADGCPIEAKRRQFEEDDCA